MKINLKATITPRFNSKQIVNETIARHWFRFQNEASLLGNKIQAYMQSYINANRKRRGGTGNLAKAMKLEMVAGAGTGRVFWGIGKIADLNVTVPYWYVVNFGQMITGQPYVPYHGANVPGSFEGGAPEPSLKGGVEGFNKNDGSGFSVAPKSPIRPMHYIEASRHQMNASLRVLIASLKRGK